VPFLIAVRGILMLAYREAVLERLAQGEERSIGARLGMLVEPPKTQSRAS
jgi:hypothetical protein